MTVFWKKNSLLENISLLVIKCEDGVGAVYVYAICGIFLNMSEKLKDSPLSFHLPSKRNVIYNFIYTPQPPLGNRRK